MNTFNLSGLMWEVSLERLNFFYILLYKVENFFVFFQPQTLQLPTKTIWQVPMLPTMIWVCVFLTVFFLIQKKTEPESIICFLCWIVNKFSIDYFLISTGIYTGSWRNLGLKKSIQFISTGFKPHLFLIRHINIYGNFIVYYLL